MPEYEDFDLDRSTAQSWDAFTSRLAEVISMMDDTADLTIGCVAVDADEVPYVRFHSVDRDTLLATATSNASLGESWQLSNEQLDAMSALGWHDPTAEGPHPGPNFWRVAPQEEAASLAELAVQTLRDVYLVQHPVFLAPDQLAEILQAPATEEAPKPQTPFEEDDIEARVPTGLQHLDELIEKELVDMFGHAPVRDDEGDFALRVGSTMVFLRPSADYREVILFSALVHDIAGRSRAAEVLNDLNTEARMVKFHLIRDRAFVTLSVFAHPFVPAHLHQAVHLISEVADGIDEDLAGKLDGRTTFEEA